MGVGRWREGRGGGREGSNGRGQRGWERKGGGEG